MVFTSLASCALLFPSVKDDPKVTRYWRLTMFSTALWSFARALAVIQTTPEAALSWIRVAYCGSIWLAPLWMWFTQELVKKPLARRVSIAIAVLFFIFTAFNFTPYFIPRVLPKLNFLFYDDKPGLAFNLWSFCFTACLIWTHVFLFRHLKTASGVQRNRIRYLFFAALLGFGGSATTFPLVNNVMVYPFGVPVIAAYPLLVAYAIFRYKVMDIDLALRYSGINALLALSVGAPMGFLAYAGFRFGYPIAASILTAFSPAVGYIVFSLLKPAVVRKFLLAGKYQRHSEENIKTHRESVLNSPSLREWGHNLCKSVQKLFDVREVVVLVFDASQNSFFSVAGEGIELLKMGAPLVIETWSPLAKALEQNKSLFIKDEIQHLHTLKEYKLIEKEMNYLCAEVCVPFFVNGGLVGILALGAKSSREMFNELDQKSLIKVGQGAAEGLRALLLGLLQQQYSSEWAHDLLHPFGSKGSLQHLQAALGGKFGNLNEEFRKGLEDVLEEMGFVSKYLDAFLNPMEHPDGMYTIKLRILTPHFERAKRLYEDAARKQGIQWIVNIPPRDIKVMADAEILFQRGVMNYLGNAYRHTPDGGTIELGYNPNGKFLTVYVKDTGPGIPMENLNRIYERGFQGDSKTKGKAGLGLYNVRKVVEAHGGKVWVESELGKGSTFFLTVPLATQSE